MFVSNSNLPDELFDRIVYFATSDYRDLLAYGSVCRDWKEMVDRSIAWKTFYLSFRPRSLKDYEKSYIDSLTFQAFHISELEDLGQVEYRKNVNQVVVHNSRTEMNDVNVAQEMPRCSEVQVEAREIQERLMGLMKAYKRKWRQYHHYLFISRLFRSHLDCLLLVGLIVSLPFTLSAWWYYPCLFNDGPRECSTDIHDGRFRYFVSMYGLFAIVTIGCVGGLLNELAVEMVSEKFSFGHEKIEYRNLTGPISSLLILWAFCQHLILLQSKFNQGWARDLSNKDMANAQLISPRQQ